MEHNLKHQAIPSIRLLKSRITYSRLFAVFALALVLTSTAKWNAVTVWALAWLGYPLVITGVFIRVYCSVFIGGRKNDELITDGPFSIVRNPLYVGSFIALAGIGMQTGSVTLLALLVGGFLAYYPFVIRREEAFLNQRFGDAYRRYMADTPSAIPSFKCWHSPAELACKPHNILRTMLDGLVFFLPLPVLSMVRLMHEHGQLPVMWLLP